MECILVVDDNEENLRLMRTYLTVIGYEVKAAANGEEAIRLLHTGLRIDFVVTGIDMPGMNGNDVARYIRKSQNPDLSIVAVTGATGDIILMKGCLTRYR